MRMSFTNCARCSWRRRGKALLFVVLVAAAPPRPVRAAHGGDIEQAWLRLSQSLDPVNPEAIRERADELLQIADRTDLARLTPLALALVSAARTHPASANVLLTQAVRLDPRSPEAWFSLAKLQLARGGLPSGVVSVGQGVSSLLVTSLFRDLVMPTMLLAVVVVGLGGFALWGVMAIRRALPRLWHDLAEMGASLRLGPNGAVLSILLLGLPSFMGCDPVWLIVWVFALCWAYFSPSERVLGCLGLLVVAASPTLIEVGFREITHPPNPVLQATAALAERRWDPQILDSLGSLSDVLGDKPDYHRLMGDCYRQFGLLDDAALAYREGLRLAPKTGPLSLGLGTVQYLQGAYDAALQSFQAARDSGFDPAVSNFDLALTLGQTYHFREGEEAMAAARLADGGRLQSLISGKTHQLLEPSFRRDEAEAMLARTDPLLLLNRGLADPPLSRERTLGHPLAIGSVLALVVAIGHFLVRQHTTGIAAACIKCGRPFCRRCRLSSERQSYCTQCVNIFLKKDMVAIDAQLAKRHQLAQRQIWLRAERRIADLFVPGLGLGFSGRPLLGGAIATVSLASVTLGAVWLPYFIVPALMYTSAWPLQAALTVIWLGAAAAAQSIPLESK
ncbi:MAG: tetratricopeptide repeat protein [Thermoanaerobaculales bacterium]